MRPRRRISVAQFRWLAPAAGAVLLVQVLRTPDLRLHFLTGASLTQGALISAVALGVVLTYRGSGVVNFATGATAMYTAYVYTGLRTQGNLFLPPLPNPLALVEGGVHLFGGSSSFRLPHWPTEISFGAPLTFPAALTVSLVFVRAHGPRAALPRVQAPAHRTAPREGRRVGRCVAPPPGDHRSPLRHAGPGDTARPRYAEAGEAPVFHPHEH